MSLLFLFLSVILTMSNILAIWYLTWLFNEYGFNPAAFTTIIFFCGVDIVMSIASSVVFFKEWRELS